MTAPVIGCAESYTAQVVDRGGAVVAMLEDISDVDWYRTLNDTSTGRVVVPASAECCESLGNVRTWRHDLVIFRNGIFVWSGPIIRVEWSKDSITVLANDITAWLARRTVHQRYDFGGTDTSAIADTLIRDAFVTDDPGHDVLVLGRSNVAGARTYYIGVGQTMDWLVDLADNGGIDFTAAGDRIVILPDAFADPVGIVTDEDLPDGLTVTEDGSELATRWHVYGADGSGVYGASGGIDPYYGLLERSVQGKAITTDPSAELAAASRVRATSTPSVFIDTQQVTLSPETQLDITRLIPGWAVDVVSRATCRDVHERLKITGVRARMTGGREEMLSITVGPLAR